MENIFTDLTFYQLAYFTYSWSSFYAMSVIELGLAVQAQLTLGAAPH
jgi:hypothetical protein